MFKSLIAATALVLSGSASASTCSSAVPLGLTALPATQVLGSTFNGAATFIDCYDFSTQAAADIQGTTLEADANFWFLPRHIDVESVSLWDLTSGLQIGVTDLTPESFSFKTLAAGSFELVVSGFATLGFGTASYEGTLVASPTSTVPEPSQSALLAVALVAAGLASRRLPPSASKD